ncbi:MAG: MFS transporter [Proteobacteria bacterium]|jgi:MFS family permease|nr:MFS transporter [Pseudomonadota bacterium]
MFWTQFAGAFNDNLYKNGLVILVGFSTTGAFGMAPEQLVALSTAIFMLPFFLFSAHGGQLADKHEKSAMIRYIKAAEIAIMCFGCLAFFSQSVPLLLAVLFLMGTQSTLFGPVKYSILPELLDDRDLVGGNAFVEMATYLAILGGTIAGGLLVALKIGDHQIGPALVGVSVVIMAIVGWLVSRNIVFCQPKTPDLKFRWNPVIPTWQIVRLTAKNRSVFLAIVGITWFWALGAVLLSLFPTFTKDLLHGNETVATLFLAAFSLGIGLGSIACERLSKRRLELGLVVWGTIGMTVFALDLWWMGTPWTMSEETELLSVSGFFDQGWPAVRIMVDLIGISAAGGLYIVPLYTLIQQRSAGTERSRVIAGNNIINAAFMVLAAALLMVLQAYAVAISTFFLMIAVVNTLVAACIFGLDSEYLLRFRARVLRIPE